MSVDLLKTIDLCNALKTRLEAIDHPTIIGAKLFEVVAFHEDKDLGEALQELIIIKKRVCLIVPSGDRWQHEREDRVIVSTRTTNLDLVLADQAYTKGGQEAAFGGANNVGVIVMKEIVTQHFAENPALTDLRWSLLMPVEGAMLEIAAAEASKAPGRQAFVLNYDTPSGQMITPLADARLIRTKFP